MKNDVMYQSSDGRQWSNVEVENVAIKMLWDSGAAITVMNKECWEKIGKPHLSDTNIMLSGVFSKMSEKPMGSVSVNVKWNGKLRLVNVLIVPEIYPHFIGGIDIMKSFGIKLVEINNIDTSTIKNNFSDAERIRVALNCFNDHKNSTLTFLIRKYGQIFMASKFDLGHTTLIKHEIKVNGAPVLIQPRRQPIHLEAKIDELVENLIKADVVRKCQSPWNSPLVIVGKKDGSIRMCVDYRQLNAVTERFTFPMPDIHFLLDCLADSVFFSSIDLGQAYYQVELDENSRMFTAFSTKQGQFCFNRIPFGLATAPATFQKLMHELLSGLIFNGVIVYLDDILVYGRSKEEHDKLLEEKFKRIFPSGLKINPEKCKFHQKELIFLGHTIYSDGIRTNNLKIKENLKNKNIIKYKNE